MTHNKLQNTIIRRIYYAYALRLTLHPVTMHGVAMLILIFALTYFVSIPNVLANLLEVRLGELAPYIAKLFLHTEIWTLVILGAIIFTILSLRIHMRPHLRETQIV